MSGLLVGTFGLADSSVVFPDIFGSAGFQSGMEESDGIVATPLSSSSSASASSEVSDAKVDHIGTSEGLSILQKVLFLSVITGCIAVYLRMNRVKEPSAQAYEKNLA